MQPWVVVKFGGTSVSTLARWQTIADVIAARRAEGLAVVVVCSALSGVSNLLDALLPAALEGRHAPLLQTLRQRHDALAADMGLDAQDLLRESFQELERLAVGASLVGETSPRLQARVMAQGELMATRLGAAWLNAQRDLKVCWEDARDALQAEPDPLGTPHRRYLSATCAWDHDPALSQRWASLQADAVLTQGFIARDAEQHTVLLGRGGSDTSAAYLAARLAAARCEIWTDVPGMFTANPRDIPAARLLRALDYDEAQEIASTGAKVLHPRAIAPARATQIPLEIRCTQHPELEGTLIASRPGYASAQVKAISTKGGVSLISMDTNAMWQQVGFLADIFAVFKRHGLSIDLVSTSEMNVTVSLDPSANALEPAVIDALLSDLAPLCRARRIGPCAAISLVGRNIRGILHQLGPVLELFEEQKVYLLSQAASDLNLSFVVDEEEAGRLVRRLHAHLFEGHDAPLELGPAWQDLFAAPEPHADAAAAADDRWWSRRRADLLLRAAAGTPRYVYDQATLQAHARHLTALTSLDRVLYAVKANPHPEILRLFAAEGLGFECVSPGEVERVLSINPDLAPERVLFTPNFAPRHEYADALARGVRVTLDNLHPLQAWPDLFAGREIFVRLDPGQGRGHHAYVRTAGASSKFGVEPEQLDRLAALAEQAGARIIGLHAHTGSGVRDPDNWLQTALFLIEQAARFPHVHTLDLGGGLGVPERPGQAPLDLLALDARLAEVRAAHPGFRLWMEPGRYLVAQAGVLLASCTQLKTKGDVRYVGLDAGMHTLIRPALYGAHHPIINLSRQTPRTLTAHVVGPICETGDTLGFSRRLPADTAEGDVFLLDVVGAYGAAMSSHYNLRGFAAEEILPTPPGP